MKDATASRVFAGIAAAVTAAAALVAMQQWLACRPPHDITVSLPGRDGRPEGAASADIATDLSGTHQDFNGVAADLPGAWPRFRGADFDNICKDNYRLTDTFPESGPEILWSVELGEGHAAPAVLNGRVYVLDYDESTRADAIRCFSLEDGQEIWRHSYPVNIKRNHGLSRTIPAVTDDFVLTIGPRCHVVCLDADTGAFRWGVSMQDEYGTTEPLWYTGQCPIIDNGLAILAPAGPEVLLTAIACTTGETVWQTPNPQGWDMSHSSIMPMTFDGTRMFVYCAVGGIVGVGRRTRGPPVVVHRASVRDGQQPAAEVAGAAQPRVCRVRLEPRLLGDVLGGIGADESAGEATDVGPVGVDEVLEGGQAHTG